MRDFIIDDFAPAVGETFEIDVGGPRIGLTLEQAEALPRSVREAGSFRLEFRGPSKPVLPQAIYRLARAGEFYDVFIVPVAQDAQSSTYEAIFN